MDFTFEAETEVLGSCSANYMGHMYVIGGSKETKQISVSKRGASVGCWRARVILFCRKSMVVR